MRHDRCLSERLTKEGGWGDLLDCGGRNYEVLFRRSCPTYEGGQSLSSYSVVVLGITVFDVDIVFVICDFFGEMSLKELEFPQKFLQALCRILQLLSFLF